MAGEQKYIINNIASKIEILMEQTGLTIFGLSQLIKVDKQPMYRVMKREHLPNAGYLGVVARHMNCTLLELYSERFFIDIPVYADLNNTATGGSKHRVYVTDKNFLSMHRQQFFGVMEYPFVKAFYKVDKITDDGVYIVADGKGGKEELQVLSVGSKLIVAIRQGQEVRLCPEELVVYAKLYRTVSLIETDGHASKLE